MNFLSQHLDKPLRALEHDLNHEQGPQISSASSYPFAIVVYPPRQEFFFRQQFQHCKRRLEEQSWSVLHLSLFQVLRKRLETLDKGRYLERLIRYEKRFSDGEQDFSRSLRGLQGKLMDHLEGRDQHTQADAQKSQGIAGACAQHIAQAFSSGTYEKKVVFISRLGSLYPFFRASALLRHLDTALRQAELSVPVVLLYPGNRCDQEGLSFMSVLGPDRDYRPRIYG